MQLLFTLTILTQPPAAGMATEQKGECPQGRNITTHAAKTKNAEKHAGDLGNIQADEDGGQMLMLWISRIEGSPRCGRRTPPFYLDHHRREYSS